jgi:hypothetical protein
MIRLKPYRRKKAGNKRWSIVIRNFGSRLMWQLQLNECRNPRIDGR